MYDELYEDLWMDNNTVTVQPESGTSKQDIIPLPETRDPEIREDTSHQRQDLLLDEFLMNEFKINSETESETE